VKKLPEEMERYEPHACSYSEEQLTIVRRDYIGQICGCPVFTVDGEYVRRETFCDFVFGGTSSRYRFCPENEIWVEDILRPTDVAATTLHEMTEMVLMVEQKQTYDTAHDHATSVEVKLRRFLGDNVLSIRTKRDAVKVADEWFQTRVLEAGHASGKSKAIKFAYHGTSAKHLQNIAEEGLRPMVAMHGTGVFFTKSFHDAPGDVILRFPWPKGVKVDPSSDEEHAFYYVKHGIDPHQIEVLAPPKHPFDNEDDRWWRPLRS
jgi:hypothetical protein